MDYCSSTRRGSRKQSSERDAFNIIYMRSAADMGKGGGRRHVLAKLCRLSVDFSRRHRLINCPRIVFSYRFPICTLPLISISDPRPQTLYTMSPSPTENAPTNLEELEELLKNDNKVKVAGTYLYLCHH